MIRHPAQAGGFYPAQPDQLRAVIESYLPAGVTPAEAIGAVCPHAGYMYSGRLAVETLAHVLVTDTVILLGPNHTGRGRPRSLMAEGIWRMPFGDVEIDTEIAARLLKTSADLEVDTAAHEYEHSLEVQLPILQYFNPGVKIVPIVIGYADAAQLRRLGRAIAGVIRDVKRDILVVASSDMSHYEPDAVTREKDKIVIDAVLEMDADRLLRSVAEHNITMCGYLPTACLINAARELGGGGAELVGYDTSASASGDYGHVVGYAGIVFKPSHPLVQLARRTVEASVTRGKNPAPGKLTPEMAQRAGAFVTLYKHGELRGCIGTIGPTRENVAAEVMQNAVSSATRDPRFNQVRPEELPELEYKVDVLGPAEPVTGTDELDAKRYGVIVSAGHRRGLLLPDLEGVDTPEQQIEICRQKGGIGPNEPITLERFEVIRYT
jgi:MEMO1 family protein